MQANPAPAETVYIVDDDAAARHSLTLLLETAGYPSRGFARAGDLLLAAGSTIRGCGLFDVRLPDMSGIELIGRLRDLSCRIPVVVITAYGDVPLAVKAMKAGAIDFIQKPYRDEEILESVRAALAGAGRNAAEAGRIADTIACYNRLTDREKDVFALLVTGLQNKQIGHELGISPRTVEVHRAHVMDKMRAMNVPQLVRMALASGLPAGDRKPTLRDT
jgi:two-component system response regulator FixJ